MLERDEIERLFRTHYGRMYQLARLILHDDEESKDVVSEVFARALDDASASPASFTGSYLLACVRNRCLDLLSHRKVKERMQRHYTLETSCPVLAVETEEDVVGQMLDYVDQRFTPQTRRVFQLRYDEHRSYREIAVTLCISETAVYKHLSQALRQLKEHFGTDDEAR